MYTYGLFMSLYSRNQHNIVKQLSSNWKQIFTNYLKKKDGIDDLICKAEKQTQT